MPYEVEVKHRLDDLGRFRQQLDDLQPTLQSTERQVDRYFNHPGRDFARTDEALRIRWDGERSWITYKGPKIDTTTKTRREIDLPFGSESSEADVESMADLLTALGFRPVARVAKMRETYAVLWHGQSVDVCVDHVDGVGDYVELECIAAESEVDSIRRLIVDLAARLGLADVERRSYLELVLTGAPS